MDKILIDTMHIAALLTDENESYFELAQALKDQKIIGIVSVVTLTELIKNLGIENRKKILDLTSTNLVFINVTQRIAIYAGDLRLKYDIPTIDSIIVATCIAENIKHIRTYDRRHFEPIKKIKIIYLKAAINMAK